VRVLAALLAVSALLVAAPALGAPDPPSVLALESELVCVTCHEPLNMSTSPLAEQMKRFIRQKVEAGWSAARIENYFVATLGPQVLAVPSTHGFDLLAWLLPLAGVAVGLVAVGGGAWVWSRNRDGESTFALDAGGSALAPALDLRVDEELARFDSER
jgi:cytochrome c-type biogenesis protein CcmH